MATATTTTPSVNPEGSSFFVHTVLPILGFIVLVSLAITAGAAVVALFFFPDFLGWILNQPPENQVLIARRLSEPLPSFAHVTAPTTRLAYGSAVGIAGLFILAYLVWRFVRENRTRGAGWALGWSVVRLFVGGFLFTVALLPLLQDGRENDPWLPAYWLLLLAGILAVGVFYIVLMYVRDGGAVGAPWALFLGALRCSVYVFLALVFLLPGCQKWEVTTTQSRVAVLFDASASVLETRDGVPTADTPADKLPTRQDQVLRLLQNDKIAFLKRLEEKNPVFAYRFGRALDEDFVVLAEGGAWTRAQWEERQRPRPPDDETARPEPKPWGAADWRSWLIPNFRDVPDDVPEDKRDEYRRRLEQNQRLFGSTNVGDSVLAGLNREATNMVQGFVVFSDGRSTEGSAQAFSDLRERAARAKVPILVVALGEDRPRVKIDIADLRVPEQARPDDRYKVAVEVTGEGLADQECRVLLDVLRPSGEPAGPPLEAKQPVRFKPGDPPRAQAEFEIDAALFNPPVDKKKPEFEEGEWVFRARVAKDPREIFVPAEHVSDKAIVRVIKRPLRVLLFAGAPTRDYQFARTLLVRESDKGRVELAIYLQPAPGQEQRRPGIVQDVPPDRFLVTFPLRFGDEEAEKPDERLYNLASYDVILAYDPDWGRITGEQLGMLERWVGTQGGGLIVVAGQVNTVQLARPDANREQLRSVMNLLPVYLQDARILDERPTDTPWRLNFPGADPEMEFLNLDEERPDRAQLAGWEDFFGTKGPAAKTLARGFFNYYPVSRTKEGATTVATFSDPRARLEDGKEQPYLVTMPYGSGKVVWLGSGEMWRLRHFREAYHERFWTKLMRFAGAGNTARINRRVLPYMGKVFTANSYVQVEAQIFGRDMKFLPETARPIIKLTPPAGVNEKEVEREVGKALDMIAKHGVGDWNGFFTTRFLVKAPGEWKLEIKVPETNDSASTRFIVNEANPELDNTRPDFDTLYWLASEATPVLERVDEATRKELRDRLTRPRLTQSEAAPAEAKRDAPRLFFDLKNAELIPNCMITDLRTQKNRGAVIDLWDKGPTLIKAWLTVGLFLVNAFLVLATLAIGFASLLALRNGKSPEMAFYLLFTLVLLLALVPLQMFLMWYEQPVLLSIVLVVLVGLLGLEWLVRKLLRLA